MESKFKEYFDAISPLKNETWQDVLKISLLKNVPRYELIVKSGQYFNYEIFLAEGTVRCYYTSSNGKEYTSSFYQDGEFISPSFTRTTNDKSLINIQALENCTLLLFKEQEFTFLRYKHNDLLALGNKIVEKELRRRSLKEMQLATENLKARYAFFAKQFGVLESKIAQRYIASYIGADPVSLSRLKNEIMQERKSK